ncbi:hypothetical protein GCM10007301_16840 [Azorhizobium oxalatiphilum]|uniref:Type VI secretion system protein ImpL n=1 Tax=Azorhizobium oxalatiphilum TaxID=980631 RepID=A0A917F9I6_9HYPH|nr:type VI secretion system membrane subunit TssM [Azorhizobium oxalatiphilum]GGF57749.1 hypothetical protein GCM10007301_16840 [Azorhizobium oxalatiphilum]
MRQTLTSWTFWRWVLLSAIVLAFALPIWLFGPALQINGAEPFKTVAPRVLTTVIILLLAGLVGLYWLLAHRSAPPMDKERQKQKVASALVEAPPASRAQKEAMERGFQLAMGVLRRIRNPGFLNSRYKYELPWYGVIGAEQSGKTALIRASGLRFPLNEARNGQINAGTISLAFSDEAVLVETRGPLVPPSEENTWTLFASLLKRHRARQPINGLLLVLSLPDLMRASDAERFSLHADLRDQLERFQGIVKARVPIYVIFTKTDAIPGFDEFCADLSTAERQAVFGVTLPLYDEKGITTKGKPLPATFSAEFDNFLRWQMPRMVSQVSQGFGVGSRFDCFMMLPHLATVKPLIADLIEDVFKPTTYDRPLLLRGFYFTSTQAAAGRGELAALPPTGGSDLTPARKAGLFIHDLLDKVIIKEAGLVEHDPTVRRRERMLRWGLATAGIVLSLAVLSWWTVSFIGNRYLMSDLERATQKAKGAVAALEANPVVQPSAETDFAAILPVLNSLQSLPTGWREKDEEAPLRLSGGLSQRAYLGEATQQEYVDALDSLLLPRIVAAVQKEIVASLRSPDGLYGALKVYLMLGHAGPMDTDTVLNWMRNLLAATYNGPAQAPLRNAVLEHVQNLLDSGIPPIELDQNLVTQARNVLNAYPTSSHGMSLLQQRADVKALQPWRLTDVAGPLAPYALTRRSGRPLSEPIEGMYTSSAFYTTVIPAIAEVANSIISDDWVRFPSTPSSPQASRVAQLNKDMTDLYINDYITVWQNMVSDVTLAGFENLQSELAVLQAAMGPPSPLASYLQSVKAQTTVEVPAPPAAAAQIAGAAGATGAAVTSAASAVAGALAPGTARLKALGQSVTARFTDVHNFVNGSPSPLDQVLTSMGQLRSLLGPAASMGISDPAQVTELTSGAPFAQILGQLKLNTLMAPPALTDSIVSLVRQTSSIANAGVKADLDSAWKTQVLPFCQAAINGKFPFANTTTDATLADFSRMFAPNGLMDQFFDKQLKSFVDTLASPWKPITTAAAHPDISAAGLATFEQAAKIRAAFFANGGSAPEVDFTLTPVDLDPGAMRVKLEVDGQSLTYQYGPTMPTAMKWPGTVGAARVEFGNGGGGSGPPTVQFAGPFAFFRLLNASGITRQTATQYGLNVVLGPRSASFTVNAASVNNPFQRQVVQNFRCPTSLVQ